MVFELGKRHYEAPRSQDLIEPARYPERDGFLEIGVDPIIRQRSDRHETLADLNVVARIDVSPRDDAVDLGDHVAIPQVEFGLSEIAVGGLDLGLGLFDVRRFRGQPSEGVVDVALLCEGREHLIRRFLLRMNDAQLSRTLNQLTLRLKQGRKGLAEIGGNLAEIFPFGLRRQSQRDSYLTHIGRRLGDVGASCQQGRLPPVVLRPGSIVRQHQLGGPIEVELG